MTFNFQQLRHHRVADQCVCCGNLNLQAAPAILMPFVADRTFGWVPALIDASWGLNTIPHGMAYTVCRSLQCANCGLLFSDIRFAANELERLYSGYRGAAYTALREIYEPGYTLRNEALGQQIDYGGFLEQFLEPLLPAGPLAILDWGGDNGKNTPLRSRARCHDVYDISNIPVIAGAQAVSLEQTVANTYDLIVCSNVLEHVPYPSDLLLDIQQAMTPQSLLYIEVPFEEIMRMYGVQALTHKKHWHEHVNFFSPASMLKLLANVGLETISLNVDATITAGMKSSYLMQIACRLK
jgi:hypothetical protein